MHIILFCHTYVMCVMNVMNEVPTSLLDVEEMLNHFVQKAILNKYCMNRKEYEGPHC